MEYDLILGISMVIYGYLLFCIYKNGIRILA